MMGNSEGSVKIYRGRFDMGGKITEINKETFWQLIEEMKKQCG